MVKCPHCKGSFSLEIKKCNRGVSRSIALNNMKRITIGKFFENKLFLEIISYIKSKGEGKTFKTKDVLLELNLLGNTRGDLVRQWLDMLVCFGILKKIKSGGTIEEGWSNKYLILNSSCSLFTNNKCQFMTFGKHYKKKSVKSYGCSLNFREFEKVLHKSERVVD